MAEPSKVGGLQRPQRPEFDHSVRCRILGGAGARPSACADHGIKGRAGTALQPPCEAGLGNGVLQSTRIESECTVDNPALGSPGNTPPSLRRIARSNSRFRSVVTALPPQPPFRQGVNSAPPLEWRHHHNGTAASGGQAAARFQSDSQPSPRKHGPMVASENLISLYRAFHSMILVWLS